MYDAALVVSSIYEGDPRGLPGEGLGYNIPLPSDVFNNDCAYHFTW